MELNDEWWVQMVQSVWGDGLRDYLALARVTQVSAELPVQRV